MWTIEIIALLAIGAIFGWFLLKIRAYNNSGSKNVPAVPFISSFVGFLFRRTKFPEISQEFIRKNKVEGFFRAWAGREVYLASDPESAQFLLTAKEDVIAKSDITVVRSLSALSRDNIVRVSGETWRRQRQVYNPAFNTPAYKSYFATFSNVIDKCVSKLEATSRTNGKPCDVDIVPWMSKMTVDVLGNSIFNYDFGSLDGKLDKYYGAYQDLFNFNFWRLLLVLFPALEPLPFFNSLSKSVDTLNELFRKMIKDNKDDERGSMLTRMLEAANNSTDSKVYLTNNELHANLFILFVAGHETTSSALSWILYELLQNPHIQEKAYAEIHEVLGDKPPTFEDLDKLTYLDNIITETLRLHPPVAVLATRKTMQDVTYKNQFIPKDSIMGINFFSIQRHPLHYSEPTVFNPDRWDNDHQEKLHRFAYLPFSLGPRMCIGNTFSLIEQRLFLSRLLQKFRLDAPKDNVLSNTRGRALNSPANVWASIVPRRP